MRKGVHDGTSTPQPIQRRVQGGSDSTGTRVIGSAVESRARSGRVARDASPVGPGRPALVGGALDGQRAQRVATVTPRGPRAADGARHLKKSHRLLRQAERVSFAFIAAEKARFPIRVLCRALEVSPSGYYAAQQRPPCARAQHDTTLLRRFEGGHPPSPGAHGPPRPPTALRPAGGGAWGRPARRVCPGGGARAPGGRPHTAT